MPPPTPTWTVTPKPTPWTAGETIIQKFAAPSSVQIPGADVTFTFVVRNLSNNESATVEQLIDDVYGDLNGQGTCSVPQVIPPNGTYECEIVEYVSSSSVDLHENIVAMGWRDQSGTPRIATDDAEVPITVAGPALGCRHCPLKITFRKPYNYFALATVLGLPPDYDPRNVSVSIAVENAQGTILEYDVLPGELTKRGQHYTYKNRRARKDGGLLRIDMFYHKPDDEYRLKIRAYGDYSAATTASMRVTISVGTFLFSYDGVWDERKGGWILPRIP
jgi:hypothetical protein